MALEEKLPSEQDSHIRESKKAEAPESSYSESGIAAKGGGTLLLEGEGDFATSGTMLGGSFEPARSPRTQIGNVTMQLPGTPESPPLLDERTLAIGSAEQAAVVEASRPSEAPALETHIGQYEIIRQLGEGGMGVVYLARDNRLGRRVAIKVLRTSDPELTRRFIVEARTTARCTHENIVVIHEAGEHLGSPFMVLEYLEGKPLSSYAEKEAPTVPHAVEIMVSVVRALVRAHEEGIVHRDLKPDNVFITESGTVKVLDFGIAKLLRREPGVSSPQRPLPSGMPILAKTRATGIAGTIGYMAPEQWHSPNEIDHRADIWAVGATLFELVTRRNPLLEFSSVNEVADFLANSTPMPSVFDYGAKVPRELAHVIAQCLKKDPKERFKDARTLLKALEPFLPGRGSAIDGPLETGPFAGLRAFQEEDSNRFFGRSRELGTLLGRLRETPLMATVGASGVGKSSFLRAGLVPALKNSGEAWEVVVCRPGRTPLEGLAERLLALSGRTSLLPPGPDGKQNSAASELAKKLASEPGHLGVFLRNRARDKGTKILFFVDQFEELYTLGADSNERRSFTTALQGAADDATSPVRVMLSVRADFLGRTTEDPDFMNALTKGLFFLGPPSEEGLREALVRPAEMMGYRFESTKIIDEMIRFLGGTPNGLPLLQFAAAQLWEARDPQRRLLTEQSYSKMGGVSGALVSHADSVYGALSPEKQNLCRTLFMYLVTPEKTRAIRTLGELGELTSGSKLLRKLVEQLVESRLVVMTARRGDATVEIVHESLITSWPLLRRWLDESHEDSLFVDQLLLAANAWNQKGRDPGLLWRGEMESELSLFKKRFKGVLPRVAEEFAEGAKKLAERSARLRRGALLGGISGLVLLLVAATVGLVVVDAERKKADENAAIAEKRLKQQLAAEAAKAAAEHGRVQAEKKTDILEDRVELDAVELAKKNRDLQSALMLSDDRRREAQESQKRAEGSEREALAAKEQATKAAAELQKLLDKERARAERLDKQLGALVEDLK